MLFPSIDHEVVLEEVVEEVPVQFGTSYVFDFQKGDFVVNPAGRVLEADEQKTLEQAVLKALYTPRYRYLVYSPDYGSEIEKIIEAQYPRDVTELELQRVISEALMVDNRIYGTSNFQFEWKEDSVYVSFTVLDVQGNELQITDLQIF